MNVDLELIALLVGIVIPACLLMAYFLYDQKRLDKERSKKKKVS